MIEKIRQSKMAILLLIAGAVYFFLKFLTPLVAPILCAMLFVTIFGPLLKKIQDRVHIGRQVGAALLLTLALLIVGTLLWILSSWIVGSIPRWIQGINRASGELLARVQGLCEKVEDLIGIESVGLRQSISERVNEGLVSLGKSGVPGMLSQSLEYVKSLGSIGGFLVTFLIATVLLAKDYDDIMNRLLDRQECHVLLEVICGVIRYIATYVKAQLVIMSIIGAVSALVLWMAGIPYGALWGLLAGFLDALPFIGTGIVLVPLAISRILAGAYGKAIICLALYAGCAFLRQILEPRLVGRKIGVPAFAVLVSLYVGIKLFGAFGIIKGPLGFVLIYEIWHALRKEES